jgi:glycosyltransferase involved in cell wall biosynthesis
MVTSVPLPPREGLGYYVWNLSRYLLGQGHEVQIMTRAQRGRPRDETVAGIPIWRAAFAPLYPFHVDLHRLFAQRLVRRLEPDVDVLHLHTPLPPPLHTGCPQLLTVHTSLRGEAGAIQVRDPRSALVRLQIPFSLAVERRLLARADQVVAVSHSVARELRGYGAAAARAAAFGNGVDTTRFCPGPPGRRPPGIQPYILAAGRLDVRKGLFDLLQAVAQLRRHCPDVHLYVAGAGPLAAPLRSRAAALGLDGGVRFLGHVDQQELLGLYRGAAAFAHAAHYEGLPTVLLEAMACATPVVSTAVSGALDAIEDGVNGLLVPSMAPRAMARAVERLLSDEALSARLGAAGRRTVEARFSWRVVGARYERCYAALARGGAAYGSA